MDIDLSLHFALGLVAGLFIVLVGLFVLVARPGSLLHRIFFLLALADGASTALFNLSYMTRGEIDSTYFHGLYWYFYVAFVTLLALFGALFPARIARPRVAYFLVALVLTGGAGALAAYAADHGAFWDAGTRQTGGFFQVRPAGNLVLAAFTLVIALLIARLTRDLARETSASHRHQAAFVLGGMTLAYAPAPATLLVLGLQGGAAQVLFFARPDRVLVYWAFVGVVVALVASAWTLARDRRPESARDRRFVLGAYAIVLALGVVTLAVPSVLVARALRTLALLAYPILLGYAIARYEVFDIDRKLRRAATVSITTVGLTLAFLVAENAAETALAASMFRGFQSQWVSGTIAAIVAALIFVPVSRASRKAAARIIPELNADEVQMRKLEIYKHSLAGAMADGILKDGESRTLAALRESLGLTESDHRRLLAEVAA